MIDKNITDIWFLDLEETIIRSWDNPILMNQDKIRDHFEKHNITNIHIFSAAIWNDSDVFEFNSWLKAVLENVLRVKITSSPSMSDVMNLVLKNSGVVWDLSEFISVWGKARAFQDFCRIKHPTSNCFLIDDFVRNEVIINTDVGNFVEQIQIDSLQDWKPFSWVQNSLSNNF